MSEVIRNRIFGLIALLAGTTIVIKSVIVFIDLDSFLSWEFLLFLLPAVAGLILAVGGIVMALGTVIRKPLSLVTNESTLGRILIGLFGASSFVMGVLLLVVGIIGLYGPLSDPEPSLQWPAIIVAAAGLVLAIGGLVMMPRTMERKPISLFKHVD